MAGKVLYFPETFYEFFFLLFCNIICHLSSDIIQQQQQQQCERAVNLKRTQ